MFDIHIKIDDENKQVEIFSSFSGTTTCNYENKKHLNEIINEHIDHFITYSIMPIGREKVLDEKSLKHIITNICK